jgi:hypothetical protein
VAEPEEKASLRNVWPTPRSGFTVRMSRPVHFLYDFRVCIRGLVKGLVIAGNSGFIVPLMSLFASQSPFPVVKLNVFTRKRFVATGLHFLIHSCWNLAEFSFLPFFNTKILQ